MFGILRYVLASLVLLTHLGPMEWKYTGYYAVLCFFTLSGYLLSVSYERYKLSNFKNAYARYYINRLLRVYPVFFVVLAFTVLTFVLFPDVSTLIHPLSRLPDSLPGWISHFTIISGGTFTGSLGPALMIPQMWSLGVELIYWLILPVMIGRPKALLLWLTASLVLLTWFYLNGYSLNIRYFSLFAGSASFAFGSCIYNFAWHARFCGNYKYWVMLLCAAYYAGSLYIFEDPFFWGLYGAVFVNVLVISAFASVDRHRVPRGLFMADKFLGDISYPLFLVHITAGIVVYDLFGEYLGGFRSWGFMLFCLLISSFLSIMLFLFIERPIFGVRDRVRGSLPPGSQKGLKEDAI